MLPRPGFMVARVTCAIFSPRQRNTLSALLSWIAAAVVMELFGREVSMERDTNSAGDPDLEVPPRIVETYEHAVGQSRLTRAE